VSNTTLYALAVANPLAQLMLLLWVLVRGRGMGPLLVINLLLAALELYFVAPEVPQELSIARTWGSTDWFDYKMTIWSAFELATFAASAFAWGGFVMARIVAWIGFTGNFALSIAAMLFIIKFAITCC
jgi:hypothetical protein